MIQNISSNFTVLLLYIYIYHIAPQSYNVAPPSYKFLYKHHSLQLFAYNKTIHHSYLRIINHRNYSYWSCFHQGHSYRLEAPSLEKTSEVSLGRPTGIEGPDRIFGVPWAPSLVPHWWAKLKWKFDGEWWSNHKNSWFYERTMRTDGWVLHEEYE